MPTTRVEHIGRYEKKRILGDTSAGKTWLARDPSTGQNVAVRALHRDLRLAPNQRLAAQLTQLRHQNIATIYEFFEYEDRLCIAMEYVVGETLRYWIRASRTLTSDIKLISTLSQVADALDYAHSRSVIHQDVTPKNIFLTADRMIPKVLDFAAVSLISESTPATHTGLVLGTPLYMAPEQILGTYVPASDQYSLAIILYEILTGRRPFEEDSLQDLFPRVLKEEPPLPDAANPLLPQGTCRALLRGLRKDPAKRFRSCREMLNDVLDPLSRNAVESPVFGYASPQPATAERAPDPYNATTQILDPHSVLFELSYSERGIGADALARSQTVELIELLRRNDFETAITLRGFSLPGLESAAPELRAFSEAARYLAAAQGAMSPHIRVDHLIRAQTVLLSIGNQLLANASPLAQYLPEALKTWKEYTQSSLASAQEEARNQLPNPFRANQPLSPEQGRDVFRGRETLVRQIEAILADPNQNSSLALLGPRRCGKTSFLQMLPCMLPDSACVFFDLQDNAASSISGFFEALVRRAREQVRAQRGIDLPGLQGQPSFETATRWFNDLDAFVALNRILISIDEFERLETLFPGDRRDLLRLMGMLRAVIQHKRRVRMLVSGVAPFEELGSLWNDHFINVRELRIGHLEARYSIELLMRPTPSFPVGAVPENVAERVFQRTSGQPFLLQLFGSLLIQLLNDESRHVATVEDVDVVEQQALCQGRYYFSNTYEDAPEQVKVALQSLARDEAPAMNLGTRRWLERRWLIDDQGRIRTPAMAAYIRGELGICVIS